MTPTSHQKSHSVGLCLTLLIAAWATIAGAALVRSPIAAGAEQQSRSKTASAFYTSSLAFQSRLRF